MNTTKTKLFAPGTLVVTIGVNALIDSKTLTLDDLSHALARHCQNDDDSVYEEDREQNAIGIVNGGRIFSPYVIKEQKLYIITEGDRSVTTILLRDEY